MRVPVIDRQTVAPTTLNQNTGPFQYRQDNNIAQGAASLAQGQQALAQGIGAAGQGAQRLTAGIAQAVERANAAMVATELAGLEVDTAKPLADFANTRGMQASELSKETYDALEKAVAKRREKLNVDQRAAFDRATSGLQGDWTRRIENHTSQQMRVAEATALDGLKQSALQTISNFPKDMPHEAEAAAVAIRERMMIDAAVRLGRSPEEKEKLAANIRSEVAMVRIARSLTFDPKTAAKQFEALKDVIDHDKRNAVAAQINSKLAGEAKNEANAIAEAAVSTIIAGARKQNGYIDDAKALAALDGIPEDQRTEMRTLLERQIRVEGQKLKADIEDRKNKALAFRLDGKPIDGSVYNFLKEHDPKFLLDLREDDRRKFKQWEAERRGDAAVAKKEQDLNDKLGINDWKSMSTEEKANTDINTWAVGKGMSPRAISDLGPLQRKAKDVLDRGLGKAADNLVSEYAIELDKRTAPAKRGKPAKISRDARAASLAGAADAFTAFVEREKREPTPDEKAKLMSDLLVIDKGHTGAERVDVVKSRVEYGGLPSAPGGTVRMRFPNGKEFDVPTDKADAARRKGGIEVR